MNRDEIVATLARDQHEGNAYWNTFDTNAFFAPFGEAWSPAENVRHLIKSSRPLVKAFSAPRFVLGLRFGKSKRASMAYDALTARYDSALDAGGKAGSFGPERRDEPDRDAWRARIMSERARVHESLAKAIRGWSEAALDRYQLPHPLLGNLTLREMLYFTLYHERHHREVVARRSA